MSIETNYAQAAAQTERYSKQLSELLRQCSLAGIAIVWILWQGKDTGGIGWKAGLAWSLVAFVVSLILDILQYALYAFKWDQERKKKKLEISKRPSNSSAVDPGNDLIQLKDDFHNFAERIFWLKAALVVIGHSLLLTYLLGSILEPPKVKIDKECVQLCKMNN